MKTIKIMTTEKPVNELCKRVGYKNAAKIAKASGIHKSTLSNLNNRKGSGSLAKFLDFILDHLPKKPKPHRELTWLKDSDTMYTLQDSGGLCISITAGHVNYAPNWILRMFPDICRLDRSHLAQAGTRPEDVQAIAVNLINSKLTDVLGTP